MKRRNDKRRIRKRRHAITHADMVQLETEAINKKEQDQQ